MGERWPGTSTPSAQRVRTSSAPPLPRRPAPPRSAPVDSIEQPEPFDRDIRRRRPPVLSFLLRMSTMRRLGRLVSLLALDFAGVALAIFTALVLKEAVRGSVVPNTALHGTENFLPFAYLLTALLFARSGLYAERGLRPGLSRIVGSLFQVAFVAVIFADLPHDLSLLAQLSAAGFKGAMLDTANKGKLRLIDHIDVAGLKSFVDLCHDKKLMAGLAGSLEPPDISRLLVLYPNILGFRSALCSGAAGPRLALGQVQDAGLQAERAHLEQRAAAGLLHIVAMRGNGQNVYDVSCG